MALAILNNSGLSIIFVFFSCFSYVCGSNIIIPYHSMTLNVSISFQIINSLVFISILPQFNVPAQLWRTFLQNSLNLYGCHSIFRIYHCMYVEQWNKLPKVTWKENTYFNPMNLQPSISISSQEVYSDFANDSCPRILQPFLIFFSVFNYFVTGIFRIFFCNLHLVNK